MSAGITQLIAVGAQDEYIMGKPEISFFSSTFKRHSNFSQSIEKQTIYGAVKIIPCQAFNSNDQATFWGTCTSL
jgi:hypothetical protein